MVLGAPESVNISCSLMHDTRLCQLDVKMTNIARNQKDINTNLSKCKGNRCIQHINKSHLDPLIRPDSLWRPTRGAVTRCGVQHCVFIRVLYARRGYLKLFGGSVGRFHQALCTNCKVSRVKSLSFFIKTIIYSKKDWTAG